MQPQLISVLCEVTIILKTYPQHFALFCGVPVSVDPAYTVHTALAMDSGSKILARPAKIVSLTGNQTPGAVQWRAG